MIKINKQSSPPVVKFTSNSHPNYNQQKWRVFTLALIKKYNSGLVDFLKDKNKFTQAYGYAKFKKQLRDAQGPKCCYCEKPIDSGAIEHFRPKEAYKVAKRNSLIRPGYYWLAYYWENMLLSCDDCNKSERKGNLFPLMNGYRAKTHLDDYRNELPVLINPAEEDPSIFISFNLDNPIAVNNNFRGEQTIEILGLDQRYDLISGRKERLRLYKAMKIIAQRLSPDQQITQVEIDDAIEFVRTAIDDHEPFSGMIRENIKRGLL
ncbi:hypothetical protein [Ancylomarina longa]|uniref:TIGR02646 family protein n=1 Tax=Ancylomarina longa TaxID=2487017 RepID=A0A434AWR7_9BACT|nr:hypothetical protein [Ancylomarina longa]RUT78943.1 hypothetical protein DLK05_05530 [Ancylomarina longa]